jgi:hypothetical protein
VPQEETAGTQALTRELPRRSKLIEAAKGNSSLAALLGILDDRKAIEPKPVNSRMGSSIAALQGLHALQGCWASCKAANLQRSFSDSMAIVRLAFSFGQSSPQRTRRDTELAIVVAAWQAFPS